MRKSQNWKFKLVCNTIDMNRYTDKHMLHMLTSTSIQQMNNTSHKIKKVPEISSSSAHLQMTLLKAVIWYRWNLKKNQKRYENLVVTWFIQA